MLESNPMTDANGTTGYSAEVSLQLRVNGCVFPLAQMGFNRVILREETPIPEGPAEVMATIDGETERWAVEIADRHLTRRVVPIVLGEKQ
jgi:hypothetical protein